MIVQGPSALRPAYDSTDWNPIYYNWELIEPFSNAYCKTATHMAALAEECTDEQLEEMRGLCEPWERLLVERTNESKESESGGGGNWSQDRMDLDPGSTKEES